MARICQHFGACLVQPESMVIRRHKRVHVLQSPLLKNFIDLLLNVAGLDLKVTEVAAARLIDVSRKWGISNYMLH